MPSLEQIKGSDGSGNASLATVQNTRSPGATTLDVDTVLGINPGGFAGSMGTPHTFTDPITSETITVISDATAVDFTGHVDGSNLEIDTIAPGYTDAGSAIGDIIIIKPTTQYADNLAEVLAVTLEDDGKLQPDAPINNAQTTLDNITPVGSVLDYAGAAAPTGWLLAFGQSLLRTGTYANLFAVLGTTYGSADGTHFNVPDLRGRVVAGQDDMGGSSANRLTNPGTTIGGVDGDVLGGAGGEETHANVLGENAAHTHTLSLNASLTSGGVAQYFAGNGAGSSAPSTSSSGSGTGHNNVQPTLILNKIIKY